LTPKVEKANKKKKRIKILRFQMHNNPISMKILLPHWRTVSLLFKMYYRNPRVQRSWL